MKVLHVATRHIRGSGAARNLLLSVATELDRGYSVHVAAGPGSILGDFPEGTRVKYVPGLARQLHPLRDALAYRHLRQYIDVETFDLVHTHQSKAGVLGRLAARGGARVVVHTIHMPSFGPGYALPASVIFRQLERFCGSLTDFFVAVGQQLRDQYLSNGIGRENQYVVIRSPVGLETFLHTRKLREADRLALRHQFGIPRHTRVIAAAGLLERRKRFPLLIERLRPLLLAENAMLVVAGAGPEEARLRELTRRLNLSATVRFLGLVDDLPSLFAISEVLVHTASVEGVPQVVIQALASGLPVVATGVDGLNEFDGAAQLTVVDPRGSGLLAAVEKVLSQSNVQAIDRERLKPWGESSIRRDLASFHQRLEDKVPRADSSQIVNWARLPVPNPRSRTFPD